MNRRVRDWLVVAFVVLGIGLVVLAYAWFSGRIDGGRYRRVAILFPDVTGLRVGDPVEVLGLPSGRVARLALDEGQVRCEALVDRRVALTVDTRFAIRSVSYLGSDRYLMVTLGSGPTAGGEHSFEGVNEALDLEETFLRLDRMMARLDPEELVVELRQAGREILGAVSAELDRLNTGLAGLNSGFVGTAVELRAMAGRLDSIGRLFEDSSTAGRLLSSDELYQELRATNLELRVLLADVRQNPGRYLRLSLF
ncbi:MAG: MlaD family protein [bacterium]